MQVSSPLLDVWVLGAWQHAALDTPSGGKGEFRACHATSVADVILKGHSRSLGLVLNLNLNSRLGKSTGLSWLPQLKMSKNLVIYIEYLRSRVSLHHEEGSILCFQHEVLGLSNRSQKSGGR
jgi:hypothetical protein